MFRFYIPISWFLKLLGVFFVGLILLGAYKTMEARYFTPKEKLTKTMLNVGVPYEEDNVVLTIKSVQLTDERKPEDTQKNRVVKVTYEVQNGTTQDLGTGELEMKDERGESLKRYDIVTNNPKKILSGSTEEFNEYFTMPFWVTDTYTVIIKDTPKEFVGVKVKL